MQSRLKPPPLGKLFVGVMSCQNGFHADAEEQLERQWGPIDRHSEIYSLSEYTDHYEREMGAPIWKYFISFRQLCAVDVLVRLKLFTEGLEREFRIDTTGDGTWARTVNLDPGYLTAWHLVLATVKNYAHRIHLQDGIYSELALLFRRSQVEPLPWTYPDYRAEPNLRFFSSVRSDYLKQTT